MSETPTPYHAAPYFLTTAAQKMQERAAQRDVAQERSMAKTVALFHTLYGIDLTEEHGWAFMLLLKLVRATTGPVDEDSMVDAAAYCALMAEAQSVAVAQNTDLQTFSYDQMKVKPNDIQM